MTPAERQRRRYRRAKAEQRVEAKVAKQVARDQREHDMAERMRANPLPTGRRFGTILADPPWEFAVWSRITGLDHCPDAHYPTMTLDAIKAIPVADLAAEHCALFLWATRPHLPGAIDVLQAWGFAYKTCWVWRKTRNGKPRPGLGYWTRDMNELLLLGVRGDLPAPAPGRQWPSEIEADAGRHSQKPEASFELIESYFPNLPKVELFARAVRPGWSSWGNEIEPDADIRRRLRELGERRP
jgi:N6-adenosine-specific RNA methylase IME4